MKKIVRIIDNTTIYEDKFLRLWFNYQNYILNEHQKFGYELVHGEVSFAELLKSHQKIDIVNQLNIMSAAKFNNLLDARSEAFRLIAEIENTVSDVFSLYVLSGYQSGFENKFSCGIITSNQEFVKILDIEIVDKDGCVLFADYYNDIIFGAVSYYDKSKFINPGNAPIKFGGIILGKGCPEVKKVTQELDHRFKIVWGDKSLSMKEQYQSLIDEGVVYIFEIKNHGKVHLRICSLDKSEPVSLENIDEVIAQYDKEIIYEFKVLSLGRLLAFEKENKVYYCSNCFANLENYISYIKPFNQRVVNKLCSKCGEKSVVKLIKIKE